MSSDGLIDDSSTTCRPQFERREPVPGSAFAIVDGIGLVEINAEGSSVRVPSTDPHSYSPMAIDDTGALWIGDWTDGADLLRVANEVTPHTLFSRDAPLLRDLAPRAPADVWLVTSDIEWTVAHYDGEHLRIDRTRADFSRPGGYSDNKLNGFARVGDAIYIACSNGLWRRDPIEGWQRLRPPESLDPDVVPGRLLGADHGALVRLDGSVYLHNADGWRRLPVASAMDYVSPDGFVVASSRFGHELSIAVYSAQPDAPCTTSLRSVPGRRLHDVTLDQRGRTWIATDDGLSVAGSDGESLMHWRLGELSGLDARIEALAVVAGGPPTLPPRLTAPAWTVEGQLQFTNGGRAVADRRVLLCATSFIDDDCKGAPFVRSTITKSDGSFRFVSVPPGELAFKAIHPPKTPECSGIFEAEPHYISPTRSCPSPDRVCDLGRLSECPPFEMPPPPPDG